MTAYSVPGAPSASRVTFAPSDDTGREGEAEVPRAACGSLTPQVIPTLRQRSLRTLPACPAHPERRCHGARGHSVRSHRPLGTLAGADSPWPGGATFPAAAMGLRTRTRRGAPAMPVGGGRPHGPRCAAARSLGQPSTRQRSRECHPLNRGGSSRPACSVTESHLLFYRWRN